MRISEGQLRRIIREELSRNDIAIAVLGYASSESVYVIAYKIDELESSVRNLQREGDFERESYNGVIAGVVLKKSGEHGECNGSWHVSSAASSEKGWGTRVYLAAIDFLRNISSDRFSVTPAAEGMWKKLSRFDFVEREEFDDIKAPKTPPTSDDCRLFPARDPALNSSWRIKGEIPSDIRDLVDRGDDHLRALGRSGARQEADQLLRNGFGSLFVHMYDD